MNRTLRRVRPIACLDFAPGAGQGLAALRRGSRTSGTKRFRQAKNAARQHGSPGNSHRGIRTRSPRDVIPALPRHEKCRAGILAPRGIVSQTDVQSSLGTHEVVQARRQKLFQLPFLAGGCNEFQQCLQRFRSLWRVWKKFFHRIGEPNRLRQNFGPQTVQIFVARQNVGEVICRYANAEAFQDARQRLFLPQRDCGFLILLGGGAARGRRIPAWLLRRESDSVC